MVNENGAVGGKRILEEKQKRYSDKLYRVLTMENDN
jgi:hypothetical protein